MSSAASDASDASDASTSSSRSSRGFDDDAEKEMKRKYACIGNVANWSKIEPVHMFDKPDAFIPELVAAHLDEASPKLAKMLDKIRKLDAKDAAEHGHTFKHMIFAGNPNTGYGAKIVGSVLLASGFNLAFNAAAETGVLSHKTEDVMKEQENTFTMLLSKPLFGKPMTTYFKKRTLELFNARPDNVHGDMIRFIVLDGGFREGIDLFDIKYIHLFEPTPIRADEKQAIGRGTRFCGQKGIFFNPEKGWPLHVFRYEVAINKEDVRNILQADTFMNLQLRYSDVDPRQVRFAAVLDELAKKGAVDSDLTTTIHEYSIDQAGGAKGAVPVPSKIMKHASMRAFVKKYYSKFAYPPVELKNACAGGAEQIIASFTPTQDFMRHFFQPSSPYKGMLAYHSVGTGKTCTGIAVASSSFEKEGYTILWVTRHTLKADIGKNLFGIVCSIPLQERLAEGLKATKKDLSDSWLKPISYKQFSNMLLQKNNIYHDMVRRNGADDPLHKTLIVIDEAHKLYAPDAPAAEKPNMAILEKMLQNSYNNSGDDSARVLLMTGTPYTKSPVEMIKLLNLLRPATDAFPASYDAFARAYLDDTGDFTAVGRKEFLDEISGYISYLDRASDARYFAYPVIKNVPVDMTHTIIYSKDQKFNKFVRQMKEIRGLLKEARVMDKEHALECIEKAKAAFEAAKAELDQAKAEAISKKDEDYRRCNGEKTVDKKACKDTAKAQYDAMIDAIKHDLSEAKKDAANNKVKCRTDKPNATSLQERIDKLKEEYAKLRDERVELRNQSKELKIDGKQLKETLKDLKEKKKVEFAKLKNIKDVSERKETRKQLNKKYATLKDIINRIFANRQLAQKIKIKMQLISEKIGTRFPADMSQETGLRKKCNFDELPDRNPKPKPKPKTSPPPLRSSPPDIGSSSSQRLVTEFRKQFNEAYAAGRDAAAKKAYRKLAITYHPDKHQSDKAKYEATFKTLNNEWEKFRLGHGIVGGAALY